MVTKWGFFFDQKFQDKKNWWEAGGIDQGGNALLPP